jgi:3-phosphoshikimate 1-carboxyvinyltransferase
MTTRAITPVERPVRGTVVPPGSKSITNRAVLLAALADGTSTLTGALVADDSAAMIDAARALGANVEEASGGQELTVTGVAGRLPDGAVTVNANQAATVGRFVSAVAAASPGSVFIDADDQLRTRPIEPLFDALRELGATVASPSGRLPATISGPADGGSVTVPAGISSQFLSALLMAGPLFPKGAQVHIDGAQVSASYVAMTSSVMAKFGIRPAIYPATVAVGAGRYKAANVIIEPDASAASYFFAAAAITGGEVHVDNLGSTSVQGDLQLVRILEAMGATVPMKHHSTTVIGAPLRGVTVDMSDCSDMVPTLAVVAATASTPTIIRGVGFIRRKETDRIAITARELRKCGVTVDENGDGLTIHPGERHGARIDPAGDHRMAMAFAVLGLVTPGIEIDDPDCVAKTFPEFFDVLDSLTA